MIASPVAVLYVAGSDVVGADESPAWWTPGELHLPLSTAFLAVKPG